MKLLSSLLAVIFLNGFVLAQNPGDVVFAGTQVHIINIQFSQSNYWDSLVYYYNQGLEQYMSATVTLDGTTMQNVGVRLKGNSSFSHPNNKKSIKLSFDEYIDTQRWDGMKSVHLNNCYGDPSFLREKMQLDFCRDAGINAPRANYANVFINDTLWAFYSLVESVDKKFLSTHYGVNTGNLFKAVDDFTGANYLSDFKWYTSAVDSYYNRYELKTDGSTTAWPQLINLLDTLNNGSNLTSSLPELINLSSLYKSIAADILFANLDSYSNSGRNFYFYFHPTTGKMEWITWDVGLSFGGYGGGVSNFENLNVNYIVSSSQRPLVGKLYSNSTFKNQYLSTLCMLFNTYFTTSNLLPKVDSIANIIRSYVYADPRKQYTNNQFEINLLSDLSTGGVGGSSRIPGIKSFINSRRTSVQTQLTNLGITCSLTVNPGDVVINEFMAQNTTIPDPAGQFDDWIELYNNTSNNIDLGGMYLSDNYSNPTKWQFPSNTIIEAGGYLIVWADEDSGQEGLHAAFKLSASGEVIRLSNTDASILDTISFGQQTANLSMARIPNGTGNFVQGQPTFNAYNGGTDVEDENNNLPLAYELYQNYPNPFNPLTNIKFDIKETQFVSLKVYDILGKEVAVLVNEEKPAGTYSVVFNAGNLSSGVYIYRLNAGGYSMVKRMALIK